MLRVASLLPSTTEMVCALGMGEALVGRSHECDFPSAVSALPVLTAPRLDTARSSREIDTEVKRLVREALSIYDVDAEGLRRLQPEVVLTQSRCEVCAVTEADVEQALAEWSGVRPRIVSLAPGTLESVWQDVERVAEALGVPERGAEAAAALRARVAALGERTAAIEVRPTVFCVEWIDPLMAAGFWVPELVEIAGGTNLVGEPGGPSPWQEWEDLQWLDPEVIAVMPCGFGLDRTAAEMAALAERPGWEELRAVQSGRVCLTDGNQYFNRPGPRLAESAEILAEILHPGQFDFGHRGAAWRLWTP